MGLSLIRIYEKILSRFRQTRRLHCRADFTSVTHVSLTAFTKSQSNAPTQPTQIHATVEPRHPPKSRKNPLKYTNQRPMHITKFYANSSIFNLARRAFIKDPSDVFYNEKKRISGLPTLTLLQFSLVILFQRIEYRDSLNLMYLFPGHLGNINRSAHQSFACFYLMVWSESY